MCCYVCIINILSVLWCLTVYINEDDKMTEQGRRKQKVDLESIKEELINGVIAIDSDDSMTRSVKTKSLTRLATKVKNQLHDDKRRKDSERIATSTYRKYLTNLRRAVTEQNWVHHSLEQQVERLSKRYPEYSEELSALLGLSITPLRNAWSELLNNVKKDGNNDAHSDIKSMKLDHEIMRHLTLPSADKANLDEEQAEQRYKKISTQVELSFTWLMNTITELLTKKSRVVAGQSVYTYNQLALGLGLATGRRQIEVLYQGEIEKVSSNQVKFIGQAKKRGGADYSDENIIYTLVDADLVIEAWNNLRSLPEIKDLEQFEALGEVARNSAINARCASNLNTLAKRTFGDNSFVFKDSRDIWARAVHDLYYLDWRKDNGKKSEDLFWQSMLGHEDTKTQIGYKKFHILYDQDEVEAEEENAVTRLAGIKALDDNEEIDSRQALRNIHKWVKAQLEQDDDAVITQSRITREVGSGRPAIKDYLALASDALNKKAVIADKAPVITEKVIEEQEEAAPAADVKPHFASKRINDNVWQVTLTIGDKEHHWKGKATNNFEAMKIAYDRFKENDLN